MQTPIPLAPSPVVPIPVNPFGVLGGIGSTRLQLAADVSNNASGTQVLLGLSQTVQAGENWLFHWDLWVGSAGGVAGGITLRFVIPATNAVRCSVIANTSANVLTVQTPITSGVPGPFVAFDASNAQVEGRVLVDISAQFSAGGLVDLDFRPNTNGQNYICRRPSSLIAWRV